MQNPAKIISRILILSAFFAIQKSKAVTYYWIWNQSASVTTANWIDVSAGNFIHLSTTSGGTANVSGSTPIGSDDNIIFDNNSTPSPSSTTIFTISINVNPRLDIRDFDASAFSGTANGRAHIEFNIPDNSGIQIFGNFNLPHYNITDPIKNKYITAISGNGDMVFSTPAGDTSENYTNYTSMVTVRGDFILTKVKDFRL